MPRMIVRILPVLALSLAAGTLTAPAEAAVDRHVWGIVVDGKGRPVLDAEVRAIDEDGNVAASALSYDDSDGDAAPRAGFFALYVPANGAYDVIVKKKGFAPASFDGVEVTRRGKVVELGPVVLDRSTTISGRVTNEVRVGQQAVVKVTVAPANVKPSGRVSVISANGRRTYGSAALKPSHSGVVNVTLDRLDKGTYELKAAFSGASGFASSTSSKFVLEVKARKGAKRPNARTWVA